MKLVLQTHSPTHGLFSLQKAQVNLEAILQFEASKGELPLFSTSLLHNVLRVAELVSKMGRKVQLQGKDLLEVIRVFQPLLVVCQDFEF